MLFHLFIFFSHTNWSISFYSGGKLTIRMIQVHIVVQCHSYISKVNVENLIRNNHMPSMYLSR